MKLYQSTIYNRETKESMELGWFKDLDTAVNVGYNYANNCKHLELYPGILVNFTNYVVTNFIKNCDFFNMIENYMKSKMNKDNSISINAKRIDGELIVTVINNAVEK